MPARGTRSLLMDEHETAAGRSPPALGRLGCYDAADLRRIPVDSHSADDNRGTELCRRVPLGNARPSVTKKQREQVKRDRQRVKAEKRAQRKLGINDKPADDDSDILWPVDEAQVEPPPQ